MPRARGDAETVSVARRAELLERLRCANELSEEFEALAPRNKPRLAQLLGALHDAHRALVERGFLNAEASFAPLVAVETCLAKRGCKVVTLKSSEGEAAAVAAAATGAHRAPSSA